MHWSYDARSRDSTATSVAPIKPDGGASPSMDGRRRWSETRLARLLVASGVASRDVADFRAVPMPTENFAELDALMAGPVQAYRERFTFEERERQRNDERSDFVGDIAENAWITTMVASVLGVAAVFVNTVLGLGDASGFARFIGLVLGAMVGLSVFANSAGAAAERRWGRAAALGGRRCSRDNRLHLRPHGAPLRVTWDGVMAQRWRGPTDGTIVRAGVEHASAEPPQRDRHGRHPRFDLSLSSGRSP